MLLSHRGLFCVGLPTNLRVTPHSFRRTARCCRTSETTRKNVTGRCQLRKDCQNSWLSSHLCNTAVSRSGASKWIR